MLSEESNKYFARAIAISGIINDVWCQVPRSKQCRKVKKALKFLGCPSNYSKDQTVDFLKQLPVDKIQEVVENKMTWLFDQFLPVDTLEVAEPSKKFISKKPLILGITAEEGKLYPDFVFKRQNSDKLTW